MSVIPTESGCIRWRVEGSLNADKLSDVRDSSAALGMTAKKYIKKTEAAIGIGYRHLPEATCGLDNLDGVEIHTAVSLKVDENFRSCVVFCTACLPTKTWCFALKAGACLS